MHCDSLNLLLIDVFSFFVFLLLQSVQQWLSSCICHITCDCISSQKWNCWVKGNTHLIFLYIPSCHPKRLYQFILSKTLSYYFPTASSIWYIISLFIFVSLIGFCFFIFPALLRWQILVLITFLLLHWWGRDFHLRVLGVARHNTWHGTGEFDSLLFTYPHSSGAEDTTNHTGVAFVITEPPEAVGGRLCNSKRVRCPLVPAGDAIGLFEWFH